MSEIVENDENTPPICVLLPICIEANTDVLLNILKSVLLHTRFHDNFHIKSMISGITSETFHVDKDDLSVDWTKLTSDWRQARQSKLLGFWAARHYPLICKKLVGASWQPPKNCNVRMEGSVEIAEADIDNIVSKKMMLRIVELNVCKNTSKKLKHFVRVPSHIGRVNVTPLSGKMTAFDIGGEHLPECWQALKLGGFSPNDEQRVNPTETFKGPQPPIVTSIDQHRKVRRICDQSTVEKRNSSPIASNVMSPCNVLLTDISSSTEKINTASESTIIPTAKRQRCASAGRPSDSTAATMHDETNFDALRVAIFDMRKDIRNLTEYLGPNAAEKYNKSVNDSECFHLAVFQQKDAEISNLKESLQRLETKNELMKSEKSKLSVEIEEKSNLVSALQKVVDVNSKLHCKMEEESNVMAQKLADEDKLKIAMTETNDKLHEELTAVKSRLANFDPDFQCEIQDLLQQLSAANQPNCEVTETNGKHDSASVKSNSQYQLQDLVQKLTATDELNMKMTETNGKLQEDVNAVNNRCASIESNLQCQIQELVHKLSAADRTNIERTETNSQLQQELNAARQHFTNMESFMQCQNQDLVHKLSAADQSNIELTETNGRLQQELHVAREYFTNREATMQSQIQEFVHKLSTADRTNIELTDTKEKLQQELNAAKIELKGTEKLNETLHNLKARTNDLTNQFRIRIEGTEKINAQLSGENAELREELNILKQNAVEDKKLFQSNSPLIDRPETHIQTERKELSSDIKNCHGQVGLEEKNIQCIGVLEKNYEEKLTEPIDRAPDEDVSIELYGEPKTDKDNDLRSEPMKSGELPNGGSLYKNRDLSPVKDFFSNNPVVQECRPVLMRQKFGWMKFQHYKNAKFCPAFVYPPDADGTQRAQKIKADGWLTSTKSPFWEFHFASELSRDKKHSQEVSGLKKFNTSFGFNFQ